MLYHGNLLHATLKRGFLVFNVFTMISPELLWYILTRSESILL